MVASQRKYICSFCAKAFSRSEHKARHERSHTGSKPFGCGVCSHSFVRRDLLQRHIRTVHKNMLNSLINESNNAETVINSLIKVSNNMPTNDGKSSRKAGKVDKVVKGPTNSANREYLSSGSSSETNLTARNKSPNPLATPTSSIPLAGNPLPMTPTDDDEVDTTTSHIASHEVSTVYPPISLDSEVLRTIFVGRFKNTLDDPEKMLNQAFSYLHLNSLFIETIRAQWEYATSDEHTFDLWCKNSPLPLALLSINLLQVMDNEKRKNFLFIWQTCWQQSMKNSYDKSFLPLTLLIYVHTHSMEKLPQPLMTTSVMYQHILYAMINSNTTPLNGIREVWSVFDIFVNLLLKSEEFTETSTLIYNWFLKQNIFRDLSLSQCLDVIVKSDTNALTIPLSVLLVVNQALFCETVMFEGFETHFKKKDSLHNAIILVNRLASKFLRHTKTTDMQTTTFNTWKVQVFILHSPAKFVEMINAYCVNPSIPQYWHLYIATWFEFMQNIIPASCADSNTWEKFHLDNRWFSNKISSSHHILEAFEGLSLDDKKINNNLAICSLSVISSLQHDWLLFDPSVKKLVLDVLLFQVKLFTTSLYLHDDHSEDRVNNSMKVFRNPIVQLLLFVWYCSIYHRSDGMPKILYRRGTQTDIDDYKMENYTLENYSVSHFIKKYIVLTRKCIDTDALIENDFKKLLFQDNLTTEDDYVYFKGFHFLLCRILETIICHFQKMLNESDPESALVTNLIGELTILINDIQTKVHSHETNYSIRPVSPMSESASSAAATPPDEMKRSNSVTIGIVQRDSSQNSPIEHPIKFKLPPIQNCATTNKSSNFETIAPGFPENAGSSHIYLPPPVPQQTSPLIEGGKCSLPPASTFLNMQ